ncbi:MAG: PstS family phosphate ABC transporter substrate-binding protein, partial [Mariprofundales bacterium]
MKTINDNWSIIFRRRYVSILAMAMMFFIPTLSVAAEKTEISYIGSSTITKYINAASKVYPDAAFLINSSLESSGGEKWIAHDRGDLGGVARDVKQKYLAMGVVATLIGYDGVGVVVHHENPIKNLTSMQIKDIFTGKIKNWQEVGGEDKKIVIHLPASNTATYSVFQRLMLAGKQYAEHDIIIPNKNIINHVATDMGGIGIISLSFLQGNEGARFVSVDGQEASLNNSNYAITRPLHLTTKGKPSVAVKKFIDWTLSPEG